VWLGYEQGCCWVHLLMYPGELHLFCCEQFCRSGLGFVVVHSRASLAAVQQGRSQDSAAVANRVQMLKAQLQFCGAVVLARLRALCLHGRANRVGELVGCVLLPARAQAALKQHVLWLADSGRKRLRCSEGELRQSPLQLYALVL
jgi:hypothetical protein